MIVRPSGPVDAQIMLVGEAPGEDEVRRGEPFTGASGQELSRMLHEAGITRSQCFITNVARERPTDDDIFAWFSKNKTPPKEGHWVSVGGAWVNPKVRDGLDLLRKEIELVKPKVIIALGNLALWALTGNYGITNWRGSTLRYHTQVTDEQLGSQSPVVVPVYHPAAILRMWEWRSVAVHDLRRAKRVLDEGLIVGNYSFIIRGNFSQVDEFLYCIAEDLDSHPVKLAVDIETRAGHIACLGIATSATRAICIPFMCTERPEGYWLPDEEVAILDRLRHVLCHPNAQVVGQNFSYDMQYIQKHFRFTPNFVRDTMVGHYVAWPGTPKGLSDLSSLYCAYHVYWKDEGKEWHHKLGEDQLWIYNCKDCVVTYEVDEEEQRCIDKLGLRAQCDERNAMFWRVNATMNKGLRRDESTRAAFSRELASEMTKREQWFAQVLGHPLNPRSHVQMKKLFYHDLGQRPIFNRKTKAISLDDDALKLIGKREPLLRPLVQKIAEHRSLGVFSSTFVNARAGDDGRIRCSFNIAGPETLRLSSSQDAFGSGLNLQTIPKGGEVDGDDEVPLDLPNVRKLFLPDEGKEICEIDLDRADLQVVVWESEDESLKRALRSGVDMHLFNARDMYGLSIPDDELVESHPNCAEHKARYYAKRQHMKVGIHATNYYCQPRTLASSLGISIHEAERFQRRWFSIHPGIRAWQSRTAAQLAGSHTIFNKFGYRRVFFDRPDSVLPEALAWGPQSTVAVTIDRIWDRISTFLPEVDVLLQVHDSLVLQYCIDNAPSLRDNIRSLAMQVVIPYDDPLTIPVGMKTSTVSWGDCK